MSGDSGRAAFVGGARQRRLWLAGLVLAGVAATVGGVLCSQQLFTGPPSNLLPAADSPGVVCFGYVDLEPGVAALAPLQPGRVAEVCVRENQHVAAGTVLLRLEDELARGRLAEAQAGLDAAQAQLDQARKGPELHRSRLRQQQDALEAMRARLSAARRLHERKQKLFESRLISPEEFAASADQIRELEALERVEAQRLADLKGHDPSREVERAEKEVAVVMARLEQARAALAECSLKAPTDGTVLRLAVAPGDVLGGPTRQAPVLFAPDGQPVVRAEVEQEFARRVAEGQAVVVEDDADAQRFWRGRVRRIAQWYSQRRNVLHDPFQLSDVRTLECLIVLDPDQPPLRIGQRVRVRIGE
jgi:multidrug resistance efflux pump